MDERRNKSGMNESAKRQRKSSEGRAQATQRTSSRPSSRDAYISNECRAANSSVVGGLAYWMYVLYVSRKPNLARGRYVGSTDIRCRLDYDILTIRRFSSVEKAELQRHL